MMNSDVCYQKLLKLNEAILAKMSELSDRDGIVASRIFRNL